MIRTGEEHLEPIRGAPLDFVRKSAGLSDRIRPGDGAVARWYSDRLPKAAE